MTTGPGAWGARQCVGVGAAVVWVRVGTRGQTRGEERMRLIYVQHLYSRLHVSRSFYNEHENFCVFGGFKAGNFEGHGKKHHGNINAYSQVPSGRRP